MSMFPRLGPTCSLQSDSDICSILYSNIDFCDKKYNDCGYLSPDLT